MIKIQATFLGYGGRACTLFSAIDPDSNVLVVSVESDYRADRMDGCIVITNNPEIPYDSLFTDEDIKSSIAAFFAFKTGFANDNASPRLVFSERAARSNPEQSIEKDGMDASGPRFRISEGVTCGQIAALATCLHASRAGTIEQSLDMFDALNALSRGEIITI